MIYRHKFLVFQCNRRVCNFMNAFGDNAIPGEKLFISYETEAEPTDEYVNKIVAHLNMFSDGDYFYRDTKYLGSAVVRHNCEANKLNE